MIVINNPKIFKEKNNNELIKLLDKGSKEIEVVFLYFGEVKSNTNELIDYLISHASIYKINKLREQDVTKIIRDIVAQKNGVIENRALISLSNILPLNLRIIVNEVNKLLSQTKNITIKIVNESIEEYFEDDTFDFVNALIEKDVNHIIKAYNKKILLEIEPINIIGQISSVLLITNLISDYKVQGLSLNEISQKTKIHIFRIKKSNELLIKTNGEYIKSLIKKLADLDLKIKSGKINKQKALDYFVLYYIK